MQPGHPQATDKNAALARQMASVPYGQFGPAVNKMDPSVQCIFFFLYYLQAQVVKHITYTLALLHFEICLNWIVLDFGRASEFLLVFTIPPIPH